MLSSTSVEKLAKKLQSLAEDVYFLPQESLRILWDAAEEAELITMLSQVNLDEYEDHLPSQQYPEKHGNTWETTDILTLDSLLKDPTVDIQYIATFMERTDNSILFKGCSLIALKVDRGYTLERAFKTYHYKIPCEKFMEYMQNLT
ncbi:hypothetical protein HK103_006809 [Boothiomyces macroporosus]|uniref:Uncharacterized protein n=1 Tax=Boothiomyces macroporosus TaxID=261099 RepID=A0AAD5Y2A4_9FUNG|nr:hypothetical protein HK103_006809 [Boothiomyces macroporosus]